MRIKWRWIKHFAFAASIALSVLQYALSANTMFGLRAGISEAKFSLEEYAQMMDIRWLKEELRLACMHHSLIGGVQWKGHYNAHELLADEELNSVRESRRESTREAIADFVVAGVRLSEIELAVLEGEPNEMHSAEYTDALAQQNASVAEWQSNLRSDIERVFEGASAVGRRSQVTSAVSLGLRAASFLVLAAIALKFHGKRTFLGVAFLYWLCFLQATATLTALISVTVQIENLLSFAFPLLNSAWDIRWMDEALTFSISAHLHSQLPASAPLPTWFERYDTIVVQLDEAFAAADQLLPGHLHTVVADSNIILVDLEFAMFDAKNATEGLAILYGESYQEHKVIYGVINQKFLEFAHPLFSGALESLVSTSVLLSLVDAALFSVALMATFSLKLWIPAATPAMLRYLPRWIVVECRVTDVEMLQSPAAKSDG